MKHACGHFRVLLFVLQASFCHARTILVQPPNDLCLRYILQPGTHSPEIAVNDAFTVVLWKEKQLRFLQTILLQQMSQPEANEPGTSKVRPDIAPHHYPALVLSGI